MIRKIALGVSALALTVGGLAVGVGPASAGKPSLSGTLACTTSAHTTFAPGLVLSIPDKAPGKPGKDHKVKIVTTTTLTGCTGNEPTSGLVPPTGGTTTSKTSNVSRLCTNQGSVPPGKTKTTLTGGAGGKMKEAGGGSSTFLDNTQIAGPGSLNNHADDIPLPTTTAALLALLGTHGNDQLYILGNGTSLGKSYANKALHSVSHSPGLLAKLAACQSTLGLTSINTTGTNTIG